MSLASAKKNKQQMKVFANQIVDQFGELCPTAKDQKNNKKRSQKGLKKALSRFYEEIYDYVLTQKLGVIKRALLARAIQTEMEEKTYERSLINQVMMAIILNSLTSKG